MVMALQLKKKDLIPPHPLNNFEIKSIMKMRIDLMVFILDIICLRQ